MPSHASTVDPDADRSDGDRLRLVLRSFGGGRLVTHRLRVAQVPTTLRSQPSDGAITLATSEPALVAAAVAGAVGLHKAAGPGDREPVALAPSFLRRFATLLGTDRQPAAAALLDHPSLGACGLRTLLDLAAGQAAAWWLEPGDELTVVDAGDAGLWAGAGADRRLEPVSASTLWCHLIAAAGSSPAR